MRVLFFLFLIVFALFLVPRYLGPTTPIIEALKYKIEDDMHIIDIKAFQEIVGQNVGSLHELDEKENSALHYACQLGRYDVIRLLLNYIAFHYASSENVFLGWKNKNGDTPLHVFFRHHHENLFQPNEYRILELLRDHEANLNSLNDDGKTPLCLLDKTSGDTVFCIWNPAIVRGPAKVWSETLKNGCFIL